MTLTLGRYSYIHHNDWHNNFEVPVTVGNFTSIACGFTVLGSTGQHAPVRHRECVSNFPLREFGWGDYYPCAGKGDLLIGSDVWIGGNVIALDGICVGHGAVIGAGAVISKSIPPYAVAVGNPIRVIRYRFNSEQITRLLQIAWWEWPDDKISTYINDLKDIDRFLIRVCG
jgi:acetyltransferase-like isoleucine patch superfamily enzyme